MKLTGYRQHWDTEYWTRAGNRAPLKDIFSAEARAQDAKATHVEYEQDSGGLVRVELDRDPSPRQIEALAQRGFSLDEGFLMPGQKVMRTKSHRLHAVKLGMQAVRWGARVKAG